MVGGFDPVRAVAAGTEQIAQPVVREVPESTSNPPGGFYDSVHGLCRCLSYADQAEEWLVRGRLGRALVGIVVV